jgi:hypothetical protein
MGRAAVTDDGNPAGPTGLPGADNVETIAEQIARAQRLLTGSLSQLRESFCAIASGGAVALPDGADRLHFDRAVVALQSEDTVAQLLERARQRVEELELAVAQARALVSRFEACADRSVTPPSPTARRDAQLSELIAVLQPPAPATQTVRQSAVAPGPLQLF